MKIFVLQGFKFFFLHTKKLKYLGSAVKIGSVGLRQSNNFLLGLIGGLATVALWHLTHGPPVVGAILGLIVYKSE